MKIIKPFGPKIAKIKFSKKLVNKINSEVDRILSKKRLIEKLDYSNKLVGRVKQEIRLPKDFVKKHLEKVIFGNVSKYVKTILGKKIKKIHIKNFWIVRQFNDEYNPIHYHNGHISGVGYLKIPSKKKNGNSEKSEIDGSIDFINGSKMFLSESIYNHQPKVGDVILFPNYLMHTAYPTKSNLERRSFSFNLNIDNNIANVFSK
tara:strand:+ start:119 stop:730 length:612 start_codon:yes stop_codon:yes gene_type:complete